jgi:hypothetical protein
MELLMSKKVLTLLFVPVVLVGCATNTEYYAAVAEANKQQAKIEQIKADKEAARINGLVELAKSGSEADRASATIALALSGRGAQGSEKEAAVVAPRKPSSPALDWASVVLPFVGQVATGYYNFSLGETQSNNNRDVSLSQHEAFTELGVGSYRETNSPRYTPKEAYDIGDNRTQVELERLD